MTMPSDRDGPRDAPEDEEMEYEDNWDIDDEEEEADLEDGEDRWVDWGDDESFYEEEDDMYDEEDDGGYYDDDLDDE